MSIEQYFFYVIVASLTIASPGPGVVLSIVSSIQFGVLATIPTILGISLGMFCIAMLAASGVGAIIIASATAFLALKYIGATYLIYLGVKLWTSNQLGFKTNLNESPLPTVVNRFKKGLFITLSNPKPMVFFIALFPQFINNNQPYVSQFALLSITFCTLLCVIHLSYALFAGTIRKWLSNNNGYRVINRASGLCFFAFALGILLTR
jgi:threonine/homoserine/homoserine lactone efflux protein